MDTEQTAFVEEKKDRDGNKCWLMTVYEYSEQHPDGVEVFSDETYTGPTNAEEFLIAKFPNARLEQI